MLNIPTRRYSQRIDYLEVVFSHKTVINTCVARGVGCPGTWGLGLPNPTQVARAPQKPALPATSHEPRQPYPAPAQAPVTRSQKLRGNNDSSNNQNYNKILERDWLLAG